MTNNIGGIPSKTYEVRYVETDKIEEVKLPTIEQIRERQRLINRL